MSVNEDKIYKVMRNIIKLEDNITETLKQIDHIKKQNQILEQHISKSREVIDFYRTKTAELDIKTREIVKIK
jgi:hypothetical protein